MKTPTKAELQRLAVRALGETRRIVEWGYGRRSKLRAIHVVADDYQEVRVVAHGKGAARRALAAALRALAWEDKP